ncbi:MAG: hypothetical protein GX386_06280 [Clostridiaceae bacterium]|nr:hypothetical protein [Clostridiaceae bacterium]
MTWGKVSMTMATQKMAMDAKGGRNSKCIQELKQGTPKVLERRLKCWKKRRNGIKEHAVNYGGTYMKYSVKGR